MWGFVASQVLISPFLDGYCVNTSYHKRIGCQATGRVCHPEPSGVENAPGVEGEGSDASPRRWLGPPPSALPTGRQAQADTL